MPRMSDNNDDEGEGEGEDKRGEARDIGAGIKSPTSDPNLTYRSRVLPGN